MTDITPSADLATPSVVPASSDRGPAVFVWSVWALMLIGALWFVRTYGGNVPFWDEWSFVGILTGHDPLTFDYLWGLHNEHRIPVPKLVLLALGRATQGDSRSGMVFNVCALGLLAFVLIRVMNKVRGRTTYPDAVFPLALLHFGHWENLLWNFQVQFVLATLLGGLLLAVVVQSRNPLTWKVVLLGGLSLILAPLCGAGALPLVPLLGAWFIFWGVRSWSQPTAGKGKAFLLVAFGLAGLVLFGLYLKGFKEPPGHPDSPSMRATLKVSLEALSVSVGPAGRSLWPYLGIGLAGLLSASALAVVTAWWRQPAERVRALGLLCFAVGVGGLVLGIGWGRAGYHQNIGFTDRYGTLTALAPCCIYFIWEICVPTSLRQMVPMALYTLLCALVIHNSQIGLTRGKGLRDTYEALRREIRAGAPACVLGQNFPSLFPDRTELAEKMEMMHRAGMGAFKNLAAPPAVRAVPLPVMPAGLDQMTWKDGAGQGTGSGSHLLFALPEPRFVYAVRLTYAYPGAADTAAAFRMFWKKNGLNDFRENERLARFPVDAKAGEHTVDVYVNDTIDQFRIHPDTKPCRFALSGIELLLPCGAASGQAATAPPGSERGG